MKFLKVEDECINMVKEVPIDVLLLDIQMQTRTSGIDIIEELKEIRPEMKTVVLTRYENEEYIQQYTCAETGDCQASYKTDESNERVAK